MQKIWNVRKPNVELQKKLAKELNIPSLIAQLLINRGIISSSEAERFISCKLSDLYSPFLLRGMDKAVLRIKKAKELKEKIVIWGDYDVDGLTAVALLKRVLAGFGCVVEHYIPHRIEEGYGLNMKGIEKICNTGANGSLPLLITVDCGISGYEEAEFLRTKGIDVIITDHHQPMNRDLPAAFCIINPLQPGCNYPFKYLSGVGLAFKLSQAVTGMDLFEHLDLVTLGTISDIAPMLGENRILIKYGLGQLSKTKKIGLAKLLEKTGLKGKDITTMHSGFILGPRLNATGRVGSAENSLKLLLTDSADEAEQLALQLNENNRTRQQLEAKTLEEALAKISRDINFKEHRVIVLHQDDWHPGVIGIVASRIVERFYRPAILLSSIGDGMIKGSGRSIDNFHLFTALEKCEEFLIGFGGHRRACGLSIRKSNLDNFRGAINAYALNAVSKDAFTPILNIDAEIPLSLLDETLISQIQAFGPFGSENPRPVFVTRAVSVKTKPQVLGKNTLKMWVCDGDVTCQAVGFKMGDSLDPEAIVDVLDIVYTAGLNEWQGTTSIELNLKDLRACSVFATQPL